MCTCKIRRIRNVPYDVDNDDDDDDDDVVLYSAITPCCCSMLGAFSRIASFQVCLPPVGAI